MILISHRGNINGKIPSKENEPAYIEAAIAEGYEVEIDLWKVEGVLYLGHDEPQYKVDTAWLFDRLEYLWIHCKNIEALEVCHYFKDITDLNYFWHEEDTVTLTNQRYIWAYPGKQPIVDSIAVLPEINNDDVSRCLGVCSDYIQRYRL